MVPFGLRSVASTAALLLLARGAAVAFFFGRDTSTAFATTISFEAPSLQNPLHSVGFWEGFETLWKLLILNLAPQVGLEPTTLRLTATEICFSSTRRCVATRYDRIRYPTPFQTLRLPPGVRLGGRVTCAIAIRFDAFLDAVGKELGKVNSAPPTLEA